MFDTIWRVRRKDRWRASGATFFRNQFIIHSDAVSRVRRARIFVRLTSECSEPKKNSPIVIGHPNLEIECPPEAVFIGWLATFSGLFDQ